MAPRLTFLRDRLNDLDRLLRGELTRPEALSGRSLEVSARELATVAIVLAMFYGACMGSFALLKAPAPGLDDPYGPVLQVIASMLKTPALFMLTLVVTLPSLYVSNALLGSRLTLLGMTRLLTASVTVNLAVLASLGTIVLFFSLTTTSYPFVVLLNVAVFGVAGVLGLKFMLQTLHRVLTPVDTAVVVVPEAPMESESDQESPDTAPSAIEMPSGQVVGDHTRLVFRCWVVLFSLVGAQMGWVLRPFIGNPETPFTWFRDRESNFFAAVLGSLRQLLFGV